MTEPEASNGVAKPPTPRVAMHFDRADRVYAPGQELAVRYEIDGLAGVVVAAVERSVVWYTEGKGEEDLGVHHFDRVDAVSALAAAVPSGEIVVRLPASPLSYEGVIVKVRWCVRVRLFFGGRRDFVSEHVFEVGDVPPARGVVERLA
ncbi:MAG: hypothetical protein EBR28_08115 [Planctomycetia bacterium]|nr:hypothetical protein [Planctomycetia bacterium]